jgi:ComF family protein
MSALIYEYPVDRLIAGAKFQGRIDFARVLGEWLGLYLEARQTIEPFRLPDHIFPVPLHRKRFAARGFNQALEIARPVAELLNVPLNGAGCRRVRDTPEQTSLSGVARHRNTRDAFEASDDVFDKRIAVIDDVITTGSTVDAMAKALCAAGAKEVLVFTVARTMPRASAA